MTNPTPPSAAVPAQPDAPAFTDAQIASACMSYRHDFGLLEPDERAKIMFTAREWKRAFAKERQSAAQGAAERAVPAPMCLHCGATEGAHYIGRCGSVMGATRYTAPAHGQTPAQTEHVAADVSKNGLESNMTGTPLSEFQEGQWWVNELDAMASHPTDQTIRVTADLKRAVAVVHHLLRASHAQAPAGADELLEIAKRLAVATDEGDDQAQGTHYVDKQGVIRCKGSFLSLIEDARAAIRSAALQPTTTAQAAPAAEPVRVDKDRLSDWSVNSHMDAINEPVHQTGREKRTVAVHRAAPAAGAVVGPGWKLVPVEPTPRMWTAGGDAIKACGGHARDAASLAYTAMLAAAPTPAAQADGGVQEDAARYRWLREECNRDYVEFDDRMFELDTDLDDAIDAALAAKGETP